MPNYNYRSNDYMRRNQCQRAVPAEVSNSRHEHTVCVEEHSSDHCIYDTLKGLPVAMAYVPWQFWKTLHSAEKALHRGTIFEELDKPFMGMGGCQK